MKSLGGVQGFSEDSGVFWSLSFERAIKAYHLVNFYIDFFSYVIRLRILPQFKDTVLEEDIEYLLGIIDGTFFKFDNSKERNRDDNIKKNEMSFEEYNKIMPMDDYEKLIVGLNDAMEEFVSQVTAIDGMKYFRNLWHLTEDLENLFDYILEFLKSSIRFKAFILNSLNASHFNLKFSVINSRLNAYFTDIATWCLSPEVEGLFNEFISSYPYHNLKNKNNASSKKCQRDTGDFYYSLNDILLVGIMERVVAGKVDLSKKQIKSLIWAILSCGRILRLEDNNKGKAKQIVDNLLALADKTNESEVMKKIIFVQLLKFGAEELKILYCNYGYYASPSSDRVNNYNAMLDNFENWWAANFISEDDKKRIAAMADCVDDNVFVACKCDEEFMWFDFKFLEADGLFKISTELYKRYVDIFSYVIDKRFIVIFILELLRSKLIEFVPDGDCKKLKDSFNVELGNNPIRRLLSEKSKNLV